MPTNANPPPSPFAYSQHMQHTPIATPVSLPHGLPPQDGYHAQQQGDYTYPQPGEGSDRKRRADDEFGGNGAGQRKVPRLSDGRYDTPGQGEGEHGRGLLGVPSHGQGQGSAHGSVSPISGHMSVPPPDSLHGNGSENGNGNGNGNGSVNNNGSVGTNDPNPFGDHFSNTNANNGNNGNGDNGNNNNNDDGELWFPPVTERRSSLAISALLGSPQPETKRLPQSMAMSAMNANAAAVANANANANGAGAAPGAKSDAS